MLKKRFALAVIISLMTAITVGCGNNADDNTSPSLPENYVADTTEPETEIKTEEKTETVTTEQAEEVTVTTEAETESETDVHTEEVNEVMTNGELLRTINDAFGMFNDKTFEADVETAKDWDIIDADAVIDENAPITAEFLISASMRATGIVTGDSTMEEITTSAIANNVIDNPDISAVDLSKAAEIVEKAQEAWMHPNFETNISVELVDGVLDLTEKIPADVVKYNGDSIEIPSEYTEDVEAGMVFILPKNDAGEGGAYKAQAVVTINGSTTITGTPASIEEVYSSITSE